MTSGARHERLFSRRVRRNRPGAVGRLADVDLRGDAGFLAVGIGDGTGKLHDARGVNKINGCAAKAAAGHARAMDTGLAIGDIDHEVELRATDFKQITKADVRFGHAPAEAGKVAGAQGFGAVEHASVFGDDVEGALEGDFGKQSAMSPELFETDVAEGTDARQDGGETVNGVFAIGAATIVFTGSEFVLDHGVADDEGGRFRNGDQLEIESAAIQQERVILLAVERDELIHDAATRADKFVFGFLAKAGEVEAIDFFCGEIHQAEGGGDFDGGGGAEAGAHGNFAVNEQIGTGQAESGLFQLESNAHRIIGPGVGGTHAIGGQIDLGAAGELLGINVQLAVVAGSDGDPTIEADSRGHDEAIVVVGVLTDEIDATRSTKYARRTGKASAEAFGNGRKRSHRNVSPAVRLVLGQITIPEEGQNTTYGGSHQKEECHGKERTENVTGDAAVTGELAAQKGRGEENEGEANIAGDVQLAAESGDGDGEEKNQGRDGYQENDQFRKEVRGNCRDEGKYR